MKINHLCFSLLVLGVLNLSVEGAAQNVPGSADFEFILTPEGGFSAAHSFDVKPSVRCRLTLIGMGEVGGGALTKQVTLKTMRTRKARVTFSAADLPAVVLKKEGAMPIAHLMVSSDCQGTIVDSNVFARRVRCGQAGTSLGLRSDRVTIATWLKRLRRALDE